MADFYGDRYRAVPVVHEFTHPDTMVAWRLFEEHLDVVVAVAVAVGDQAYALMAGMCIWNVPQFHKLVLSEVPVFSLASDVVGMTGSSTAPEQDAKKKAESIKSIIRFFIIITLPALIILGAVFLIIVPVGKAVTCF